MGRTTDNIGRRRLSQAITLALGLTTMGAALSQSATFNIAEQDAATAIPEFARQAGIQIIAPADKLKGVKTHSLHGVIDSRAALKQLLEGTGLIIASDDGRTISLRFSKGSEKPAAPAAPLTQPDVSPSSNSELEEVVVRGVALQYRPNDQTSATGLALPLIDTPQSISVLTSNMFDVTDAQSIYYATDLIPGVIHDGTGFGIERILLRGVSNMYERVNGMELNATTLTVDGFALDRVEVVRGPATALYGITGSFGGEINSILKRPSKDPQFVLGYEAGSFNTSISTVDATGAIPGSNDALTGRFVGKFDNYSPQLNVAPADGIKNHREVFLTSLSWEFSPSTSSTVWWYHENRNIDPFDGASLFLVGPKKIALPPDNVNPESDYFSNPSQSTEHTEQEIFVAEFVHTLDNSWRFSLQAMLDKYEQQISYFYPFGPFGAYGLPANDEALYTYDITRSNENVTTDMSLGGDFELFGRKQSFYAALEGTESTRPNEFTLLNSESTGVVNAYQGGQGVYADGAPILPVSRAGFKSRSVEYVDTKNLRGSVQLLINPADRFRVMAGLLLDRGTETDTVTISKSAPIVPPNVRETSYAKLVKRLGVVYDLVEQRGAVDGVKSYINYSEGFQPQTLVNKAGIAVAFPQNMKQYEAGLKAEFLNHAVGSSVAVYNYTITNVPANDTVLASFGQFGDSVADGDQKATGVEAEVVGELLPGWNLSANYAYTETELTNPAYTFTTPVANVPKHKGTIASSYEFLAGPARGLRVGTELVVSSDFAFVGGLPKVNQWGQLVAGGYQRLDFNASYKGFSGSLRGFEVFANLHNALDERILFSKQGNPSYGIVTSDVRALNFGLRYRFQ
jgi:iron complex outermembrane receptor protein